MRKILYVSAAALAAAACGGGASSQDAFVRATPAFEAVALEITSSDASSSRFEDDSTVAEDDADDDDANDAGVTDACHPHLFLRTHEVVNLFNRGVGRILGPVHRTIGLGLLRHKDGFNHVWERALSGVDFRYTVTKTGDQTFTATLEVKAQGAADSTFVTIYQATTTRDPANHDGSGTASLDLGPLATLTNQAIGGQLSLSFTVSPAEKKVIFTMTSFKPRPTAVPRSGHFVFDNQPGKGGSLKFVDDLTLRCTGTTPAATGTTPVKTVARWFVASDGSVHFRGDAEATGGQIQNGDTWMGLTCAQGKDPRETYWLFKLEKPDGSTALSSQSASSASAACDSAFGAVPSIDSSTNDFGFSSINFTNDDVVPFPAP